MIRSDDVLNVAAGWRDHGPSLAHGPAILRTAPPLAVAVADPPLAWQDKRFMSDNGTTSGGAHPKGRPLPERRHFCDPRGITLAPDWHEYAPLAPEKWTNASRAGLTRRQKQWMR